MALAAPDVADRGRLARRLVVFGPLAVHAASTFHPRFWPVTGEETVLSHGDRLFGAPDRSGRRFFAVRLQLLAVKACGAILGHGRKSRIDAL